MEINSTFVTEAKPIEESLLPPKGFLKGKGILKLMLGF